MPKKSIVWLASYPKSGNTWTRLFIGNYLFNRDRPLPINNINQIGVADSASNIYRAVAKGPFDPANPNQALRLRARALHAIVSNDADVNFVKTHNFNGPVMGIDLIPEALTRSAICIVRDPRDVVVSYARHFGHTIEKAVESIGRESNTTAGGGRMVKQFLGSWSSHVRSWAGARGFPVLVLRYEDMRENPHDAFAKVLAHIGMTPEPARLDRAIRFSSFDELQRQEGETPFIERSDKSERFFHTGTSGQWVGKIPQDQLERIERDHGQVMRTFGYLPD